MLGVRKALNKGDQAEVETVSVLVAVNDLGAATILDETNTEFRAVPLESAPEDAITDRGQYLDRVLKVRALPGDWITMSKLSEPGESGLSTQIPPGMRVVTISVNQTTSHSGMMLPGNRVDVMLTYQSRSEQGTTERTRTVLQYIEIFAVDKLIDGAKTNINEANARNVSVLVTPEQAHLLLLAGKKGEIHLALRSNQDKEHIDDLAVSATELEGDTELAEFGRRSRREELKDLFERDKENGDDPEDDDIRAFLESAANGDDPEPAVGPGPDQPPATVAVAEPAPNTWTMTIYAGGEATTHEIVVEEDEADEPVAPAAQDTASKPSFWRGLIGTYLNGV